MTITIPVYLHNDQITAKTDKDHKMDGHFYTSILLGNIYRLCINVEEQYYLILFLFMLPLQFILTQDIELYTHLPK